MCVRGRQGRGVGLEAGRRRQEEGSTPTPPCALERFLQRSGSYWLGLRGPNQSGWEVVFRGLGPRDSEARSIPDGATSTDDPVRRGHQLGENKMVGSGGWVSG